MSKRLYLKYDLPALRRLTPFFCVQGEYFCITSPGPPGFGTQKLFGAHFYVTLCFASSYRIHHTKVVYILHARQNEHGKIFIFENCIIFIFTRCLFHTLKYTNVTILYMVAQWIFGIELGLRDFPVSREWKKTSGRFRKINSTQQHPSVAEANDIIGSWECTHSLWKLNLFLGAFPGAIFPFLFMAILLANMKMYGTYNRNWFNQFNRTYKNGGNIFHSPEYCLVSSRILAFSVETNVVESSWRNIEICFGIFNSIRLLSTWSADLKQYFSCHNTAFFSLLWKCLNQACFNAFKMKCKRYRVVWSRAFSVFNDAHLL